MYRIPSALSDAIENNRQNIRRYRAGEISAEEMKSLRVPMGIYEQRKDEQYLIRLRSTGGLMTPHQLKRVAEEGARVHCSHIHITTRQELQIHGVKLEDITSVLVALKREGLSSQGGGGNTVRNMLVDVSAGISRRQVFDPLPYAVELTSRLIAEDDSWNMPRKLKIAFDTNEADAFFSLVADLGFIPVLQGRKRGFQVLLGGSVAAHPHKGWRVFDFLPKKHLYRAAKAAKNFFHLYGDREHRNKARIRYIFYKYGEDEAKRLYLQEYEKLLLDPSLDFAPATLSFRSAHPSFPPLKNAEADFLRWKERYAQRQTLGDGFSAIIHLPHGNAGADFFAAVGSFLESFGNNCLRFTPRQAIQLRNVPEEYLPNVYHFFKSLSLPVDEPILLNDLCSCTGADTCRLGICLPKGLVKAIRRQLEESDLPLDQLAGIRININGCQNSCAQNAWADLGFSGRAGRKDDRRYPAYTIWVRTQGAKELAEPLGNLAAKHIPAFVEHYLRAYLAERAQGISYQQFAETRALEVVSRWLEEKGDVPDYVANPDFYKDWGAKNDF